MSRRSEELGRAWSDGVGYELDMLLRVIPQQMENIIC